MEGDCFLIALVFFVKKIKSAETALDLRKPNNSWRNVGTQIPIMKELLI